MHLERTSARRGRLYLRSLAPGLRGGGHPLQPEAGPGGWQHTNAEVYTLLDVWWELSNATNEDERSVATIRPLFMNDLRVRAVLSHNPPEGGAASVIASAQRLQHEGRREEAEKLCLDTIRQECHGHSQKRLQALWAYGLFLYEVRAVHCCIVMLLLQCSLGMSVMFGPSSNLTQKRALLHAGVVPAM